MRAGHVDPGRRRALGHRGQGVGVRDEGELLERLFGFPVLPGCVRRHEQRPHLVLGELDLGQIVRLLYDLIPLLDLPDVGGRELDGDTDVTERVLVPFEHPFGGGHVPVLIGGDAIADLVEGERPRRVQHEGGEVHQTLERVHPADDSAGTGTRRRG